MSQIKNLIPNLLSISRLFLIAPLTYSLAKDLYLLLGITTFIIVISDYLDGYFARKFNTISESGKILDPVADKICTAAAAMAMVRFREFPLWLLLSMVARDLLILLAGLFVFRSRHLMPVSDLIGRITMGVMTVCFIIYLLDIEMLKPASAYLTLLAMIVSLFSYARRYLLTLKQKPVLNKP